MTPVEPDTRNDGFVTLGGPTPVPQCPQFRAFVLGRLHPVTGYCLVRAQPRCFRIPDVAAYRNCCCSRQFEACPWYQKEGCPGGLNPAQEKTDV
jgi:hypothetical protein